MKLKMISLTSTLPFLLSSCLFWGNCEDGKGPMVTKTIKLESFTELELSGSHHVYLSQGDIQKVEIRAQENLIELLNTEVKDGEWDIKFKKCINTKEKIEFRITVPELSDISIEGSGKIMGQTPFNAKELDLEISGSGDIVLELQDVKELSSEINGSGDIDLKGESKSHEIEINGSGDVGAFELVTDKTVVEINGSGGVKANVSFELDVEVNGSGDVVYKGDAKNLNSSINGSGSIKQEN